MHQCLTRCTQRWISLSFPIHCCKVTSLAQTFSLWVMIVPWPLRMILNWLVAQILGVINKINLLSTTLFAHSLIKKDLFVSSTQRRLRTVMSWLCSEWKIRIPRRVQELHSCNMVCLLMRPLGSCTDRNLYQWSWPSKATMFGLVITEEVCIVVRIRIWILSRTMLNSLITAFMSLESMMHRLRLTTFWSKLDGLNFPTSVIPRVHLKCLHNCL